MRPSRTSRARKPASEPSRHVVPRRDGEERAGVVDESGAAIEARGLGHRRAEAVHGVRGVEEPPRRADVDARVEAGERSDLAREDRLVDAEQDEVEVLLEAVGVRAAAEGSSCTRCGPGCRDRCPGRSARTSRRSGCGGRPACRVMTSPSSTLMPAIWNSMCALNACGFVDAERAGDSSSVERWRPRRDPDRGSGARARRGRPKRRRAG